MDMLIPVYHQWCDMIFDGKKTVEFRKRPWKSLKTGDKFYFYEPKRFQGSGLVVGHATIQDTIPVHPCSHVNRKLLRYWAEFVRKDQELVGNIDLLDGFIISGSTERFSYDYIYSKEAIQYIKSHDKHPSISGIDYETLCKAQKMQQDYEQWQKEIGFRDPNGESPYFVGYALTDPVRYAEPHLIEEFKNQAGKYMNKAPQSGCYIIPPCNL